MKKRIISLLLAMMMLVGMMSVSAFAAGTYDSKGAISLKVDSTDVYVGDKITVTVEIGTNPGLAGLELVLEYGDGLTLGEITQGEFAGNWEVGSNGVVWAHEDAGENTTATGTFATVTFTVNAEGSHSIGVKKAEGGIIHEGTEKYVEFDVTGTSVTATKRPYTLGDVYVDGRINSRDAALVASYAVGNATLDETQKLAAEVTGDGRINSRDASKIASYAVGNITEF